MWLNPAEQEVIRQVQDWHRAGQRLHGIAVELAHYQVATTWSAQ